jgi:hypothetical protein
LAEKDEKFALTLECRGTYFGIYHSAHFSDLLIKHRALIDEKRRLRDQAVAKFAEFEASLGRYELAISASFFFVLIFSEAIDNLERILVGANTGIEKMKGHIDDATYEPEKVFSSRRYCVSLTP